MDANILFICGSLNQTIMMHHIARNLPEYNCFFTPFYADGLLGCLSQYGLLDFTILGGRHRQNTETYLAQQGLPGDFAGRARDYDLVVTCTDLLIQKNIQGKPLILVQEGITEPEDLRYNLVRSLKLPRFLANTAATGLSDAYDVFCVASPGYHDLFTKKGVKPEKIVVTGIPNFDCVEGFRNNDFPHRNYVLATTSSARQTLKWDDRREFILEAQRIAAGRQLIFKLHPNEDHVRAEREIQRWAPGAQVFRDGNTNHMIANCEAFITQYSSVVFIGLALEKEIHSAFDLKALRALTPIQNGGTSGKRIAEICHHLITSPQFELRRAKLPTGYRRQVGQSV